ncbi:MAG: hypothetical protein QY317_16555 [Candidatus Jettenia caeni]|nr:MAG: hypothetical protein QY317_16555 [Candidatus Jettenia caeni]
MELKIIKYKILLKSSEEIKYISIASLNNTEIETFKEMKIEQLNRLHESEVNFSEIQQILQNLKIINHILDMRVNIRACHQP